MTSQTFSSGDLFAQDTRSKSSTPDTALPLTPPASDERRAASKFDADAWIQALEDSLDRLGPRGGASRIKLPPQHYGRAMKALERRPSLNQYIEDKVRLDYDPGLGLVVIRMPAPVHDVFSTSVANEIYKKLQVIDAEHHDKDGVFAAQIVNGGSSRILLDTEEEKALQRHPDAQFQHPQAAFPGVVLEVSYSQDGKDLEKLAWEYIQHSNGDIKAVVGIDINYGVKPSTVSLWRPEYAPEEGEEILGVQTEISYQPFRSPTGEGVNQSQHLRLELRDFATDELSNALGPVSLSISYERLAEFLSQAEEIQKAREQGPTGGIKSSRKLKRRRRSSSPDRLLSGDEAQFDWEESRALASSAVGDDDYQPQSYQPRRKRRT